MARGGDQVKLAKDILEGGDPQDESDIPKEVPPEADRMVDPDNVMRGYEATVSNPTVSDRARENARNKLNEMGYEPEGKGGEHRETGATRSNESYESSEHKDPGNVARGYKATISNPGVSEAAKENAKNKLQEMGY